MRHGSHPSFQPLPYEKQANHGSVFGPPPLRPFDQDKPTLLVCWWITIFCAVIIVARVLGRFLRTEKLFREDKTAALALIPLFLRMGCVHYVLLHGTNNADFTGVDRVLYASTLCIFKITIVEFFKRLTDVTWERSYRRALNYIWGAIILTFIAVVISDLAECRPFPHYWQVLPDPGPQCRQGYAQLLTFAVCNVLTDLLLVFFPIPIILRSAMPAKRKIQLVLLFSLNLSVVATTVYRVPHIIEKHGSQQYRSLLASVELLFATSAANALVLGSFVRDRGVKKQKWRYDSEDVESTEYGRRRSSDRSSHPRRPTLQRHWGSDEDLVRELGLGVKPELRNFPDLPPLSSEVSPQFSPAPLAKRPLENLGMDDWRFPTDGSGAHRDGRSDDPLAVLSEQQEPPTHAASPSSANTSRRPSLATSKQTLAFFDVGGLLDDDPPHGGVSANGRRDWSNAGATSRALRDRQRQLSEPSALAVSGRRGSAALLQDLGGLFSLPSQSSISRSLTGSTTVQAQPRNRSDAATAA
ncbi:unnamed protein product [Parascedosporium putredinis]|uniref:Rhodopsin domain-containing protein n=1 Tax=Parascedosporium putredinis TaxID=1442378 RepID=A0A9P1GUL4_9PEZI|nr:unnamed protein product [Parascedosporium putredinis]CAI7987633.1 unnamed protein product [Parascedosporium putredinis]